MEHLRIKQQMARGKTCLLQTLRQVLSQNGLKGLYQGNSLTLMREFVGSSSYFLIYEVILRLLVEEAERP